MIKERKRPGPKPKPAEEVRSASVTMRTYPHVKAEMQRIGTAEVERRVMLGVVKWLRSE